MRHRTAITALLLALVTTIAAAQQVGRLKGTVIDENGKPIPGVQVSVQTGQPRDLPPEVLTDTAGGFSFENVAPGRVALKLTLTGMPDQERVVDVQPGRLTTTTVELNLSRLLAVLETVIVTARRVDEQLQTTPVPVSAITTSTLAANRLDTVDRVVQIVPNAVVEGSAAQFGTQVTIRGVQAKPITLAENGVGFYRNGQYFGGTIPNVTGLIDVEQVEVLRGPQGGLFGRNAVGGAVNFIYATPRKATEAAANVRYGSFERADVDAMVNVPLGNTLDARIVGWRYGQRRGEHYNVTLNEEMDNAHDAGGRLGLRWVPRADVSFVWVYEKVDTSGPNMGTFFEQPRPHPLAAYGFPARPAETKATIRRDTPSRSDNQLDYVSNQFVWAPQGMGELTVEASYRRYQNQGIWDYDYTDDKATNYPGALVQTASQSVRANSQFVEVRYATVATKKIRGLTGISFYREDLGYDQQIDTTLNLAFINPALGIGTGTGKLPAAILTDSWSGFGELRAALSPKVEASASLRYNHDAKSAHLQQYIVTENPVVRAVFASQLPAVDLSSDRVFTNWSPGADIAYRPSDTVSVYARVNTGFRAGGFNAAASSADLLPFTPETSVNYEAGIKSEWLKRRLRVNASFFRFDQNELLLNQPDPVTPSFSQLRNLGRGRTDGAELELTAQPVAGLTIGAVAGFLDATIRSGDVSQGFGMPTLDISGLRISGTSRSTGALYAQWSKPIANRASLEFGMNYRLKSRPQGYYTPGYTPNDKYALVDASVGMKIGTWQASLFGENLTDDHGVIYSVLGGGAVAVDRRLGRAWGVKVGYRFR